MSTIVYSELTDMEDGRVRPEMILYTLNGNWLGVNQEFKPSFEGNLD